MRFGRVNAKKCADFLNHLTIPFYEKCGFVFLTNQDKDEATRKMYFDLLNFV